MCVCVNKVIKHIGKCKCPCEQNKKYEHLFDDDDVVHGKYVCDHVGNFYAIIDYFKYMLCWPPRRAAASSSLL